MGKIYGAWRRGTHDTKKVMIGQIFVLYQKKLGAYCTEADELKILEIDKEEILLKDTLVGHKIR